MMRARHLILMVSGFVGFAVMALSILYYASLREPASGTAANTSIGGPLRSSTTRARR